MRFSKSGAIERGPRIVHEDNHLLIVDKPAGMLSQGDDTGDRTVLDWGKSYVKHQYDKPGDVYLGLAHRLDRPVSGLIILARTSKALSRIQPMFAAREIRKTYLAVVRAHVTEEERTLVHWVRHDESAKRMRAHSSERQAGSGAQRAELTYRLLARVSSYSLLEVSPLTGRRHQIRVQLAAAGMPLEGDLRYGASGALQDRSVGLHAYRLEFEHPVGKGPVDVTAAPYPKSDAFKHFAEMIEDL